jgi:hypothetical protein
VHEPRDGPQEELRLAEDAGHLAAGAPRDVAAAIRRATPHDQLEEVMRAPQEEPDEDVEDEEEQRDRDDGPALHG